MRLNEEFKCNKPECVFFENCKTYGCGTPSKKVRDGEECPICKGYGKLHDPVHTWAHVQCHACDGTGIESEWHKKLHSSRGKAK